MQGSNETDNLSFMQMLSIAILDSNFILSGYVHLWLLKLVIPLLEVLNNYTVYEVG